MTAKEDTKTCCVCKEAKSVAEFGKKTKATDGLMSQCKGCRKAAYEENKDAICAQQKMRYAENPYIFAIRNKAYNANNKEAIAEKNRIRYIENKEALSERHRLYYLAHKETIIARSKEYADAHKPQRSNVAREYYAENKDRICARGRAWRKCNPERTFEYFRAYGKANPGKRSALGAKRRASKLQATPAWFEKEAVAAIYEESILRSKQDEIVYHVDHIVPLRSKFVCGLHCLDNLEIIPGKENLSKGNRHWPGKEWIIHKPT
jgi:hypothetical protein